MKRLYIGLTVLALLLAFGLTTAFFTSRMYAPITALLNTAAEKAMAGTPHRTASKAAPRVPE